MRTTLTLDPEVVALLEEEARRSRKAWKQVVNDAIRRGLSPRPARATSAPFRVRPHVATLVPGIDPARLNALADELEDDALLAPPNPRKKRAS